MNQLDFSLATTDQIIKEIARRAKKKRKSNIAYYGKQDEFARHIGMSYRTYQEYEISGKTSLEKFINILRGLDSIEEIQELLQPSDDELFKKERKFSKSLQKQIYLGNKKLSNKKNDKDSSVDIPDVFD